MDSNDQPPPIVCTLTTKQAAEQVLEWQDLRQHAEEATAVAGGVRMTFPAAMTAGVRDLAQREQNCCAFLDITTVSDDDRLTLEVTSANPDALPIISQIAGIPLR